MPSVTLELSGGVNPVLSYGQCEIVLYSNTWAAGDTWYLRFTSTVQNFTVGRAVTTEGDPILVGAPFVYGLTFSDRVYLTSGKYLVFSGNNTPTGWYEQDVGSGYIRVLSQYGGQDAAVSIAAYQGFLAVFLRQSIQIWQTNADPSQFQLRQTLANIGTSYGFSVQSLGDWDVLFLADSGIRSLQVRDSSLNAVTTDVGSPIDALVLAKLAAGLTKTPVSIVEPEYNRYWLFLEDTIYVLSLFRDGKVRAWSTYAPTVQDNLTVTPAAANYDGDGKITIALTVGTQYKWTKGANDVYLVEDNPLVIHATGSTFTAASATGYVTGTPAAAYTGLIENVSTPNPVTFVPLKFVVRSGEVYCRGTKSGSDYLIKYGGGYDLSVATVQSPFLSLRIPTTNKYAKGVDVALTGAWTLSVCMDQYSQTFEAIDALVRATYDGGVVGYAAAGTHTAFKFVSSGAAAGVISSYTLIYELGEFQ